MRKRFFKTLALILLGVMLCLECLSGYRVINSHAAEDTQISYYLYPFEEAVEALEQLAGEEEIQAVVYLADEVAMKSLPEESSDTVKMLLSGDVVQIIGAGQDANYEIWYQVVWEQETERVVGYVKRAKLSCVHTGFAEWESNYVRSASVFRRMAGFAGYEDIEQFPESYQDALYRLKEQHPDWIFVKMNTGISWKTLVNNQLGERSLIYASTSPAEWKNGMYGEHWAYASERILKYYLDPRNFLTENGIFQFELLGYSEEFHTVDALNYLLNGTFMYNTTIENGKTYAQNFVELGQTTQVSPFLMATRIRQEQGAQGTSALISGTYKDFEGFYNYYNIGAHGKTDEEVILNGLTKAKTEGWDSRYKSLEAGANFLGGSYIKHGQDTLYLQKFDVDSRYDGIFWHQYMQNIEAPYKEALSVKRAYEKAGLLDSAYIFRIPVYEGMPSSASVLPGQEDKITLSSTEINNLQVDAQITLHPFINGEEAEGIEWEYTSSDTSVATVDDQGVVTALKLGEALITCRKTEDMDNTIEGTCKITVIKADVDINELDIPELEAITYDPEVVLGDISLPQGYTWVNPEMVPVVKQTAYAVEYNLDDTKYNSIVLDIPLTVNKAVPQVTVPTGLEGGATRELSSVLLPQGYYWMEPSAKLPDTTGTITCLAGYNPDIENYESVENISLTVKVICDKHNFGEWQITEAGCETDGKKVRSCTICGEKEEITLPATGHSYEAKITREASESEEGQRLYTCSNCQHSYTETIPRLPTKHEHSYQEEIITKASCTTEGLRRYTCSCNDSYEEIIPASGHKMEGGSCTLCGYKESTGSDSIGTGDNTTQSGGNAAGGNTGSGSTSQGSGSSTGGNSQNSSTGQGGESAAGGNNQNSSTSQGSGSSTGGNSQSSSTSQGSGNSTGEDSQNNSTSQGSGSAAGGNNQNSSTSQGGGSAAGGNNQSSSTNQDSGSSTGGSSQNNNTGQGSESTTGGTTSNGTQNSGNTASNSGTTNNTQGNGNTANSSSTTSNNIQSSGSTSSNTGRANTAQNTEGTTNTVNSASTNNATDAAPAETINTVPEPSNAEEEIIAGAVKQVKQENSDRTSNEEKVIITLNNNTRISEKIVDMAASHDVDLELELPNALRWSIDAGSLNKKLDSEIDMDARLTEGIVKSQLIEAAAKGRSYLELRLAHNGEFGFMADLTIPVDKEHIGKTANLFYDNEKTQMLEFVTAASVSQEAEVILTFSHASDYLIVFADGSMEMEDISALGEPTTERVKEQNTEEPPAQNTEEESFKTLVFVVVLIMLFAVFLVVLGIWLSFRKKEGLEKKEEVLSEKETDYFEELATSVKRELKEEKQEKKRQRKQTLSEEDYFDEDVDDYRERS